MKKILLAILLLALICSCFCACGPENGENETEAQTENSTKEGETQAEVKFAEADYKDAEYRILCTTQCEEFYNVDEENASTTVELAAFNRNAAVEEKYHVIFDYTAMEGRSSGRAAFATTIRNAAQMDQNETFDLVIGQTYYTMAMALEGMYYNMNKSTNLNLDREWYDKELCNDTITIGGRLYAVSGSYVISQVSTAMGLYFNKGMYEDKQLTQFIDNQDIYQMVRDGNWTFEEMVAICKEVYEDADFSQTKSAGDVYGFVGNIHSRLCALVGSNLPFTEKDEATGGLSVDNYYSERLVKVYDDYRQFYNEEDCSYYVSNDDNLIDYFANNQALFCCHAIEYLAKGVVRGSDVNYGILPFPKYDEAQDDYYTNNIRWEVAHILKAADTEKACIVFEYLNYTTYKDFIPVYFDQVMSYQSIHDENDMEMLQLIRKNIRFDFCTFYQAQIASYENQLYGGVRDNLNKNSSSLETWWTGNKTLYKNALNDLIDTYLYFLED